MYNRFFSVLLLSSLSLTGCSDIKWLAKRSISYAKASFSTSAQAGPRERTVPVLYCYEKTTEHQSAGPCTARGLYMDLNIHDPKRLSIRKDGRTFTWNIPRKYQEYIHKLCNYAIFRHHENVVLITPMHRSKTVRFDLATGKVDDTVYHDLWATDWPTQEWVWNPPPQKVD